MRCDMRTIISLIIITVIVTSCRQDKKFDRELWLKGGDLGIYPARESMVNDLIANHPLKGLRVADIRNKLGQPYEIQSSDNTLLYEINTYYSSTDIDPTGSLSLIFWFDKDSIIIRHDLHKEGHH